MGLWERSEGEGGGWPHESVQGGHSMHTGQRGRRSVGHYQIVQSSISAGGKARCGVRDP